MNKSELIDAIAEELDLPRSTSQSVVNSILVTMADTLGRGEPIYLRGFGSFTVNQYESYVGRNPKTGEKIQVQPMKRPHFKVGKDLRERVNRRVV